MKLSKQDLAKVTTAVRNTKRTTKLVSLPNEMWEQLKSAGIPVPKRNFTISSFLYGKNFDFVQYAKRLSRDASIRLVSLLLAKLGCFVERVDNVIQISDEGLEVLAEIRDLQADHIEDIALIIDDEPVTKI